MAIVQHLAQAMMTSHQTRHSHATDTQILNALRARFNEDYGAILHSMTCAMLQALQARRDLQLNSQAAGCNLYVHSAAPPCS